MINLLRVQTHTIMQMHTHTYSTHTFVSPTIVLEKTADSCPFFKYLGMEIETLCC